MEHVGKEAVVLLGTALERASASAIQNSTARLSPDVRDNVLDLQQAPTQTSGFSDGIQRETCVPIGARKLAEAVAIIPDVSLSKSVAVRVQPAQQRAGTSGTMSITLDCP